MARPGETAITVISRAGSSDRGFSLLELILVLMVLALSSSIVLPNIEKRLEERAIRVSALGLAAVARHVRSRALNQGIPQRLVVNVSQNSYRGEGESEVFLPPAVRFAELSGGEMVDQGIRQFVFFPNGSSYSGAIALRGVQRPISYWLHFEALTGRIEVARDENT